MPPRENWAARFGLLGGLLDAHDNLWRPPPFHIPRPAWCDRHPDLTGHLLGLSDDEVVRLTADNEGLIGLVSSFIPELGALRELIALPAVDAPPVPVDPHAIWRMPGRKQEQIEAFAAAIGKPVGPVLEWCAGKGHLGRLLAMQWGVPVVSLDHDAGLCADGEELAQRVGVGQCFVQADALAAGSASRLQGRHAIGLHACGDLHRALLRGAVEQGAAALDLAPCCYDRSVSARHEPLNPDAALPISRSELHLAITDTATAGAREIRQRDTAMAWKLGFVALRADATGDDSPRGLKPVPPSWLALGFEEWCRRLAAREGLALAAELDLGGYEAMGWQRQREVVRLSLVRLAFRRPLEVWLALDQVLYLERHGFQASLAEFCSRSLTPRNLLVSAR